MLKYLTIYTVMSLSNSLKLKQKTSKQHLRDAFRNLFCHVFERFFEFKIYFLAFKERNIICPQKAALKGLVMYQSSTTHGFTSGLDLW